MRTRYIVVSEDDKKIFTEKVEEFLHKGWNLQGGVSVSVSESDTYYYTKYSQALTKLESE